MHPDTMKQLITALWIVSVPLASRTAASTASDQNPFVVTKCDTEPTVIGTIRITQPVLANGEAVAAGVYEVRATSDYPAPAAGQSAAAECWVQLVKNGVTMGREVATVIPDSQIADVAKGPRPAPNGSRVGVLKGGDYLRAWINHDGVNYILNLPVAGAKGSHHDSDQ